MTTATVSPTRHETKQEYPNPHTPTATALSPSPLPLDKLTMMKTQSSTPVAASMPAMHSPPAKANSVASSPAGSSSGATHTSGGLTLVSPQSVTFVFEKFVDGYALIDIYRQTVPEHEREQDTDQAGADARSTTTSPRTVRKHVLMIPLDDGSGSQLPEASMESHYIPVPAFHNGIVGMSIGKLIHGENGHASSANATNAAVSDIWFQYAGEQDDTAQTEVRVGGADHPLTSSTSNLHISSNRPSIKTHRLCGLWWTRDPRTRVITHVHPLWDDLPWRLPDAATASPAAAPAFGDSDYADGSAHQLDEEAEEAEEEEAEEKEENRDDDNVAVTSPILMHRTRTRGLAGSQSGRADPTRIDNMTIQTMRATATRPPVAGAASRTTTTVMANTNTSSTNNTPRMQRFRELTRHVREQYLPERNHLRTVAKLGMIASVLYIVYASYRLWENRKASQNLTNGPGSESTSVNAANSRASMIQALPYYWQGAV